MIRTSVLTPKAILADLDDWSERAGWPDLFGERPETAYHAMRLIAARAPTGDGYGIVFERLEGSTEETLVIRPYVCGSELEAGPIYEAKPAGFYLDDDAPPRAADDIEGVEVTGPRGPLRLSNAMIAARDLRPGMATGEDVHDPRFALLLHAYMAEWPDAFWTEPNDAIDHLGLGDSADILLVSASFAHVLGAEGGAAGDAHAQWNIAPSASPTYRSLAAAIAAREASRFAPGPSNLDWRKHALRARPCR